MYDMFRSIYLLLFLMVKKNWRHGKGSISENVDLASLNLMVTSHYINRLS